VTAEFRGELASHGRIRAPTLGFPFAAIHQLYVHELRGRPSSGPRNGLLIPAWLFMRAGLIPGEKVTLTREYSPQRPVSALNNRTVAPVFASNRDVAVALGPTAQFLASDGPSCCIAYSFGPVDDATEGIDLSFGSDNRDNLERDLVQRGLMAAAPGLERDVLYASINGLTVGAGDPYCNPTLAELPVDAFVKAKLPVCKVEAYFSPLDRSGPALQSYAVPTSAQVVSMSGALFGAFPVGSEVVVDIYTRVTGSDAITATLIHLPSRQLSETSEGVQWNC
jgi:hypothetical protein